MGQKDTPRQPSSLERLHQARNDKEVGTFRKTKKQPEIKKKPTRVAEFEFDPAWVVPGGVIHYRQSGKIISMQEEIIRLMKSTPPQPNPFGDWRKPVNDAKLNFVEEMIQQKYGVRIEWRQTGRGDYIEFFSRGNEKRYRMSMTEVLVAKPDKIIDRLETAFDLSNSRVKTNDSSGFEKAKNPTESWAEKWARENQ